MKISSITIERLFGLYSYSIPEIDKDICLITSPNGYGKTTILYIINNLCKGYLFYFYNLPFKTIRIKFENELEIVIEKHKTAIESNSEDTDSVIDEDTYVIFKWINGNGEKSFHIDGKMIRRVLRIMKHQLSINEEMINDLGNYKLAEIVTCNNDFYKELAKPSELYKEFQLMLHSLISYFIPANRIYNDHSNIVENDSYRIFFGGSRRIVTEEEKLSPIKNISNEFKEMLSSSRFRYLVASRRDEDEFINSLLKSDKEYEEEDYNEKVREITLKNELLIKYGLNSTIKFPEYNKKDIRIISAYLDETIKRLAEYDPILEKLELFSDLLNEKHFANKFFTFSLNYGIRCFNDNKTYIDLDLLSSGEKNQIILLYDLIFRINDNSILLLDEPENSLHVAWQRMFSEDIALIAENKNLQAVITTHSSRIVANAKEKAWDLFYLNKEFENYEE